MRNPRIKGRLHLFEFIRLDYQYRDFPFWTA